MTIRGKLIHLSGLVFLLLLAALVLAVRFLLVGSFIELETREVRKNVERVENYLADEIERIRSLNKDWAFWDDTVSFVEGRLPRYITDNLTDSALVNLRVNFMVFADSEGRVRAAKIVDLASGQNVRVPAQFVEQASMGGQLLHHDAAGGSHSGTVMIAGVPALVSSLPVLGNGGTGPVHGALLAGVFIDDEEIAALSKRTRLSVALVSVSDPAVKGIFTTRRRGEGTAAVRPIDASVVAGYIPLRDVSGAVVMVLRLTLPRETYAQGLRTTFFSVLAFALMGLLLIASIYLLFNRIVLRRVSGIGAFMDRLSSGSPFSDRLAVQGRDELSRLAGMVNRLLDTVERTNSDLQSATEEAVVANRAKSDFLANMSHELRTPLNHVIGFTDLLLGRSAGPLAPMQEEYLRDVGESSQHLLSLINDILDLSKVEAGKLELELSRFDPKAILDGSFRMVAEKALVHGIGLALEAAEAPAEVVADERKVKQILFNLLSNAVKFTPDGGRVEVKLRQVGPNGSPGGLAEFSVSDSGIGLSAEDITNIFAPYARGHGDASSRYEGTGLGLALSKRLVELHGGRIWAESEGAGKGSVFTFVLPLEARRPRQKEGKA